MYLNPLVQVSGLVYALIFAAVYTETQSRLDEIRRSLVQEANGVHTAMLLVVRAIADRWLCQLLHRQVGLREIAL